MPPLSFGARKHKERVERQRKKQRRSLKQNEEKEAKENLSPEHDNINIISEIVSRDKKNSTRRQKRKKTVQKKKSLIKEFVEESLIFLAENFNMKKICSRKC